MDPQIIDALKAEIQLEKSSLVLTMRPLYIELGGEYSYEEQHLLIEKQEAIQLRDLINKWLEWQAQFETD